MRLTAKELREVMAKRPGRLTKLDLAGLTPRHIEHLSPHHIYALTTDQLLGMSAKQIASLTQEQVAVLSFEKMGLVPPAKKAARRKQADVRAEIEREVEKLIDRMRWDTVVFFLLVLPLVICCHKIFR